MFEMNELVGSIHGTLSGGKERLMISYEPSATANDLKDRLKWLESSAPKISHL